MYLIITRVVLGLSRTSAGIWMHIWYTTYTEVQSRPSWPLARVWNIQTPLSFMAYVSCHRINLARLANLYDQRFFLLVQVIMNSGDQDRPREAPDSDVWCPRLRPKIYQIYVTFFADLRLLSTPLMIGQWRLITLRTHMLALRTACSFHQKFRLVARRK